jgi:hypothetical protein
MPSATDNLIGYDVPCYDWTLPQALLQVLDACGSAQEFRIALEGVSAMIRPLEPLVPQSLKRAVFGGVSELRKGDGCMEQVQAIIRREVAILLSL